jgi:hypothetical protein
LAQTGVTHIIAADMVLNDIGAARDSPTPSADDIIAGEKQLIERAHARAVKILGATLTPSKDRRRSPRSARRSARPSINGSGRAVPSMP